MANQPINTPPPGSIPPPHPGWAPWGAPQPSGQPFGGWSTPPGGYMPPPPPPVKNRKPLLVVFILVLALALGGTALILVNKANSDNRIFADNFLPPDTQAAVVVNGEPDGLKKLQALQFFKNFPSVGVGQNNDENLISQLLEKAGDEQSQQEYQQNIKPWLGHNLAIALRMNGPEPHWLAALSSKNDAKARAGLDELISPLSGDHFEVRDHVVYISDSAAAIPSAEEMSGKSLADNQTYRSDLEAIHARGEASWGWGDLGALSNLTGQSTAGATIPQSVRVTMRIHLGASYAEMLLRASGGTAEETSSIGKKVTQLPADTAVAVGATGLGSSLRTIFNAFEATATPQVTDLIDQAELKTGLNLPEDIIPLVGNQTVAAMAADLHSLGITTDSTDEQASRTATTLMQLIDPGIQVAARPTADGTVLATSQEYADALTRSGSLGKQSRFELAVPEAEKSSVIFYADVEKLAPAFGQRMNDDARAIKAIGFEGFSDTQSVTLRARVVVGQ